MRTRPFRLDKYYLDCIDPDGAACIAYAARLEWGPAALQYAAVLECAADGTRRERHCWRGIAPPVVSDDEIRWQCDALAVRGTWLRTAPPIEATLHERGRERITWHNLAPRARAEVRCGDACYAGTGYAERLVMTVKPWRLPFDTLRWGRWHGGEDTVVWIAWDGATRKRVVYCNGEPSEDATFEDERIVFGARVLSLHDTRTIHDAPITAAIADLPALLRRVPLSFAQAREVKWVSRGCSRAGAHASNGWALHEVVRLR